jgi:hypothetical protein
MSQQSMELRVKVYSLAAKDAVPVLTCKGDVLDSKRYNAFRVQLEEFGVVDWSFDFWDPSIYIIPSLPASDGSRKCHRLEVDSVSSNVVYCDVPEDVEYVASELEGVETLPNLIVNDMQPVKPAALSRINTGDEPRLRSLLILAPFLARFVEGEKKLKKELAGLSLEDHAWYLKTWNEKGVGLVKVHCCECGKDFGTCKWDHNNAFVLNLF